MKDFDFDVPVLDASKFRWTKNPGPKGGHLGVAMASDIGLRAGQSPVGRCYSDACDLGCTLVNDKRETSMKFVLEQLAENEGDIQFWKLSNCEDPSNPINVIIYND